MVAYSPRQVNRYRPKPNKRNAPRRGIVPAARKPEKVTCWSKLVSICCCTTKPANKKKKRNDTDWTPSSSSSSDGAHKVKPSLVLVRSTNKNYKPPSPSVKNKGKAPIQISPKGGPGSSSHFSTSAQARNKQASAARGQKHKKKRFCPCFRKRQRRIFAKAISSIFHKSEDPKDEKAEGATGTGEKNISKKLDNTTKIDQTSNPRSVQSETKSAPVVSEERKKSRTKSTSKIWGSTGLLKNSKANIFRHDKNKSASPAPPPGKITTNKPKSQTSSGATTNTNKKNKRNYSASTNTKK